VIGEFPTGLFARSQGSGDAGNLTIDTRRLLVRDGAQVGTSLVGSGKGGNLQITASESVEVIGRSTDGRFGSSLFAQSQGSGNAGNLTIDTQHLLVSDRAFISAATRGSGKGGNLQITAAESVEVIGRSSLDAQSQGNGDAGDLRIDTRRLLVRDGSQISAATIGSGKGGNLQITAAESVEVDRSGLVTQSRGNGDAGDLRIDTQRLLVRDGAQVSAGTFGAGNGGNLQITASELVEVIGRSTDGRSSSGLFTQSDLDSSGDAGNLTIDTRRLLVRDGAIISSRSIGEGTAGNIAITVRDTLEANNGTISTNTTRSAGGAITIKASAIRLFSDSNITSNVASGANNGGNINLTADSILAFDDSDILAFARDGRGGDITLKTRAFFGANYRPAPRNTDSATFNGNGRVDVNATGTLASGTIVLPDTSFIQNSLTDLPENQIDTNTLLASSCIVRRNQPIQDSFTITGTGGLPQRPGKAQASNFPTVEIETLPGHEPTSQRVWQKGDAIVEPQGIYRLPNGKLILSRNCL
jgi:large exoprotein involved in heme utilization and adhesion